MVALPSHAVSLKASAFEKAWQGALKNLCLYTKLFLRMLWSLNDAALH